MICIQDDLKPASLLTALEQFWSVSATCIATVEDRYMSAAGAPVFTVAGKYTSQGWTEWTQGFQYGSALLQFDATGEEKFLDSGRRQTVERMAPHLTHAGVHDHGFNNVSTYGGLWRMHREGRLTPNGGSATFTNWHLRSAGRCKRRAGRTRRTVRATFIHSMGHNRLFVDTIRSCRALALAHQLGHVLMGEQDEPVSLLQRMVEHATNRPATISGTAQTAMPTTSAAGQRTNRSST